MITFIAFIIALSIMVTIHELGHFLAAKKSGVMVEEFGLGFPPRLFKKKIGETVYSLNLILIGGYVKLFGEESSDISEDTSLLKRAFFYQPAYKRAIIISSGVVMNLVLAVVVFASLYTFLGIPQKTNWVKVVAVSPHSPAEASGIKQNDWILALNNQSINTPNQLIKLTKKYPDQEISLIIGSDQKRQKEAVDCPGSTKESPFQYCRTVNTHARSNYPEGQGPLGVVISNQETIKPPVWKRPLLGTVVGFKEAMFWGKMIAVGVGQMIGNLASQRQVPTDITGPVGIYQISDQIQQKSGLVGLIHFFAVLSVNLAVLNAIPFPALDGGQLAFIVWEAVTKRKISTRTKTIINQIGLGILLIILLAITIGDVGRIIK